MDRTILHVDMDTFYASVECLYDPSIRNKPVAVGGDAERRHGIILAKNYIAKKYGVQTGEALWQAKQKCPGLVIVPPSFDRYLRYSRIAREIYSNYTDKIESYGLDECWLDVGGSKHLFGDGQTIANELRQRIKHELGVTVSVGVSFNKIFAKLGSDMKKPDATTVITRENFHEMVWPLPVSELLFVGRATAKKLNQIGIRTIGQLAHMDDKLIKHYLGKNGLMLHHFAKGYDISPVAGAEEDPYIKSVGNSTTAPRDLVSANDIKITLYLLAESVAERLREQGLKCLTIQVSIRDKDLSFYEQQGQLRFPSCTSQMIAEKAYELYRNNKPKNPVRSLGVRACKLTTADNIQLSFLPEVNRQRRETDLEKAIDVIRRRFGHFSIQRAVMLSEPALSSIDPKGDHIIHPEPFCR